MTRNFRSTREILDGINRMFIAPLAPYESLRSEKVAGRPGIEILPSASKEAEPERIVRRVRALLAEGRTPGQIAVLLRSPRTHGLAFERAFREAGIRFGSSGGGGYYDRPEVRDLVALLRAVRNPLDDQALVRVLRGPLYRAPNSALAQAAALRARREKDAAQPLFTVLDRAEHPAVRRAGAFLAEMTGMARRLDLPGLIHSLLRDSGYQGYLQTLAEDIRMRMEANLRKFYVLAEAFAGRHLFTGLEEFLDYVVEVGRQETVESEA
ncbi:MAG: 3'-5' exonuclease, partial [bacterium]